MKAYPIKITEIMAQEEMVFKVKGVNAVTMGIKIAIILLKIIAWILPMQIKIEIEQ